MSMTKNELEAYFLSHNYPRYEREGWDNYCEAVGLKLAVPCIHVTGSNGKGTTCLYLASIYQAAGYRVATFNSPFFYHPNEMIQINGVEISDADLLRIFESHQKLYEKYQLSSFEIQVDLAYSFFNEKKPDLAVIEVGMGGVLDATNLANLPTQLAIITSVSLEHTAYLGRTISEIALHKGGIVKEGAPLLTGKLDDSAESTLRDLCLKRKSAYTLVDDYHGEHLVGDRFHFDYRPYHDLVIASFANYQLRNASLAVEATKILAGSFPVKEEAVRQGLLVPSPILRLEKHGNIWIDGAHNPEAIAALMGCFSTISQGGKPVHVVFASFKDKNIALELPMLGKEAADITLTTFDHPRARQEMDYFLYEADYPFVEDYKKAISDDLAKYPDDVLLICGGLAFAAVAREYVVKELHR
jgi:dihydrofolate synthase/folylpolyglutamate synthase